MYDSIEVTDSRKSLLFPVIMEVADEVAVVVVSAAQIDQAGLGVFFLQRHRVELVNRNWFKWIAGTQMVLPPSLSTRGRAPMAATEFKASM